MRVVRALSLTHLVRHPQLGRVLDGLCRNLRDFESGLGHNKPLELRRDGQHLSRELGHGASGASARARERFRTALGCLGGWPSPAAVSGSRGVGWALVGSEALCLRSVQAAAVRLATATRKMASSRALPALPAHARPWEVRLTCGPGEMASVPFCPRCGTLLDLMDSDSATCSGCKFSCRYQGERLGGSASTPPFA